MADTPPIVTLPQEPGRIRAIKAELNKCVAEYATAKDQFEKARVEFEIAREKLSGVRQLAANMLTTAEWQAWRWVHQEVMYAGMPIGEAIKWSLWSHAWDSAHAAVKQKKPYTPEMGLDEIFHALEKGGYDFRTATPLREINGALMQLKDVTKLPNGDYRGNDADEILKEMKEDFESGALK